MTLPPRMARRDSSVPLSRTRIPLIVVQDRLCSVHAAEAFCGGGPRLCVVNVKLTIGLANGAGLLGSAHSITSPVFSRAGAGVTQGEVKQFGRRAGRGGDVTRDLRAKISTDKGGLSQSPPFFFAPRTGPIGVRGYDQNGFQKLNSSVRSRQYGWSRSVRSSRPPALYGVSSRTGSKDAIERFKIMSADVFAGFLTGGLLRFAFRKILLDLRQRHAVAASSIATSGFRLGSVIESKKPSIRDTKSDSATRMTQSDHHPRPAIDAPFA